VAQRRAGRSPGSPILAAENRINQTLVIGCIRKIWAFVHTDCQSGCRCVLPLTFHDAECTRQALAPLTDACGQMARARAVGPVCGSVTPPPPDRRGFDPPAGGDGRGVPPRGRCDSRGAAGTASGTAAADGRSVTTLTIDHRRGPKCIGNREKNQEKSTQDPNNHSPGRIRITKQVWGGKKNFRTP